LLCGNSSLAQILFTPIQSDPHRKANKNATSNTNTGNFRIAATTTSNPPNKVRDTLKLPFFDDFTSLTSPIDSFHNQAGQPIRMTTYGLHGLYNGNMISIFGAKTNANLPSDALINTSHYIKRIDAFTIELYSDATLTIAVNGTNSPIVGINRGAWSRSDYKWNQNPDTLKWENRGGVYINDRYGVDPPSYNVATFDGLNANGVAYSTTNNYRVGGADTLTSLPINLLPYQPKDSLVMSFYYQAAGRDRSEIPDLVDSINLEMKDKNGAWNIVWSMMGDTVATDFKEVFLSIKNSLYFYNGFQFRFHSYGNLSGSFDVWNLDYIVLDTNRTVNYTYHPDVSISKIPVSILNKYTSIPYKDFFNATVSPLKPSENYVVKNLSLSTATNPFGNINSTSGRGISDAFSNIFFEPIQIPNTLIPGPGEADLSFPIDASKITNQNHKIKLKYSISGTTSDVQIDGIQYQCNDSASSYNMLDNYYAYDDSSAEWGTGLTSQGEVAVKYVLAKAATPDTIIGVDIYFPHILLNHSAQPFVLTLWRKINPDQKIRQQSIALNYENLNQYKRYMLDSILIVTDSFYVGYSQSSNYYIPVGFDVNTDSHDNIFYNVSGNWIAFSDTGSLMIRPVFGSTVSLPTGLVNSNVSVLDCDVFPNPGTGVFHISGDVKRISITDLSGRVVFEKEFSNSGLNEFDASSLPEGFYLMRIFNDKASGVKKIVISR
jgi:hypothetical protein